ncbi:hypothetical protein BDA96_10G042700 [Sorghum bicolor]|uniref:Uncharacterized protein n=2 Tax=Sorghum bicolor TaxID=4558 RepID=A0A921Q271_SORBI|nr:hypothetical protein BDA96_10G042700 [Sorghum bicolor]OQU75816.1 hypothetical protein SORBI_3010G036901 [Sorghum bicolor]
MATSDGDLCAGLKIWSKRCMGAPHRQARLCGCSVLTATLTVAFTWKIREVLPLGLVVAAWVAAAATVGGGFYVLFLHGQGGLHARGSRLEGSRLFRSAGAGLSLVAFELGCVIVV